MKQIPPFYSLALKNIFKRENKKLRCGDEDTFLLRDIYEKLLKDI